VEFRDFIEVANAVKKIEVFFFGKIEGVDGFGNGFDKSRHGKIPP
jgi:hypothetical protein